MAKINILSVSIKWLVNCRDLLLFERINNSIKCNAIIQGEKIRLLWIHSTSIGSPFARLCWLDLFEFPMAINIIWARLVSKREKFYTNAMRELSMDKLSIHKQLDLARETGTC